MRTHTTLAASLFLALAGVAHAAVERIGGAGDEAITAATTGRDAQPLFALSYTGAVTLPANTALAAADGRDVALLRFDGGAGRLARATRIGGAGDQVAYALAESAQGQVLVAGATRSGSANEQRWLASVGGDGTTRFARNLGGTTAFDRFVDVASDADGNIYAIAQRRSAQATPGSLVVASFRADGSDRWSFELGDGQNTRTGGGALALLGTGATARVVVYGTFEGTLELRGTAAGSEQTRTSAASRDLFLASYDAATGARVAHSRFGNDGRDEAAPGAITVDSTGRILVGAAIEASAFASWFPSGGCTGVNASGLLVMRLSPELGCEERWLLQTAVAGDAITQIATHADGIVVAGMFNGTIEVDPSNVNVSVALNNGSGQDPFLVKLASDGSFDHVAAFGDSVPHANQNATLALALDPNGNAWTGGAFTGTVNFDALAGNLPLVAAGGTDAFVARVSGCGSVTTDPQLCRLGPQGKVSGSFLDASIASEGVVVEMLGGGRAGMYWYTFPPDGSLARQMWIVGTGRVLPDRIEFDQVFTASGPSFGPGYDPARFVISPWGRITLRFTDCNTARLSFAGPAGFGTGTRNLTRLTGVDRHTCNRNTGRRWPSGVGAGASGSYYELASAGQGFSVHITADGIAVMSFYTFEPDGTPFWVVGAGLFDGRRAIFDDLVRAQGTAFFPHNQFAVRRTTWGTAIVEFLDCNRARATFQAGAPYGSDVLDAVRLGSIDGVVCPDLGE